MNLEQLQGQMFAEMQNWAQEEVFSQKVYQLVNKDEENNKNA